MFNEDGIRFNWIAFLKLLSWPCGIRLNEAEVYKLSNRNSFLCGSVLPVLCFIYNVYLLFISRCRRRVRRRAHRAASSQSSTWRGWTSLTRWYHISSCFPLCRWVFKGLAQCSGSITFWCGSGSAYPCLWLMDPDPDADPDPSIFIIDLQDANKKRIFLNVFLHSTFWRVLLHHFSKIKSQKEVTKLYGSADPYPDPPQNVMDSQHWF